MKALEQDLAKQNDKLKKGNEELKEESRAQKVEIAELRSQLKKMGVATKTKEQLGSNGDITRVEANSHDTHSEIREAEKADTRVGSIEAAGMNEPYNWLEDYESGSEKEAM